MCDVEEKVCEDCGTNEGADDGWVGTLWAVLCYECYMKRDIGDGERTQDVENKLKRGDRLPLPSRRTGATVKIAVGGLKVYVRCSNYSDGTLGEIFLDAHKQGTTLRGLLSSFAISVSLALQYGTPLQSLVNEFVGTKFPPDGPVVGSDRDTLAPSIMDAIFHELADQYDCVLPNDGMMGSIQ